MVEGTGDEKEEKRDQEGEVEGKVEEEVVEEGEVEEDDEEVNELQLIGIRDECVVRIAEVDRLYREFYTCHGKSVDKYLTDRGPSVPEEVEENSIASDARRLKKTKQVESEFRSLIEKAVAKPLLKSAKKVVEKERERVRLMEKIESLGLPAATRATRGEKKFLTCHDAAACQ
jgi:hypothetical protein